MDKYLLYSAYELGLKQGARCPLCFEEFIIDDEDEEKYFVFDNEVYHADCINELMTKFGIDYIKDKCLKDFAEWYLDCTFNNFRYEQWLFDYMLADTENVLIYVGDNINDFMRWNRKKNG